VCRIVCSGHARLFGIRGGGKAYEQSLHEASLLEVEAAATTA
jgi:hypothetical protein